jgi:hypothetical protein
MALHPDVIAELEAESAARSAARREKEAAASLGSRVSALEARMAKCEEALANAGNAGVSWAALPGFLVQCLREYTAAQIKPLDDRVAELENGSSDVRQLKRSGTFK